MTLITLGINHKTAPLAIREKLAFSENHTPQALSELMCLPAVNEAVLLSTCNRTEIYTHAEAKADVLAWLNAREATILEDCGYCYEDIAAVRHLMRVASGLDSMVVGESQILGQIKRAFQMATAHESVGLNLKYLFPAVFSVSKQIRHQTAIGASSLSLAYTAVQLAKQHFPDLASYKALIVGAGETMELVATHLYNLGLRQFVFANRTIERAKKLADVYRARAIRIADIPVFLQGVDLVFTATASQLPILGKGLFETVLKRRPHDMFIVDLAVPRDIEAQVADFENVTLYNIDDLRDVISANLKNRELSVKQAEAMVELEARHYIQQMRVLNASELISRYRDKNKSVCENELEKALLRLQSGEAPKDVLQHFGASLINKIMHHPTIKLRDAAYHDKTELLLLAKELFEL